MDNNLLNCWEDMGIIRPGWPQSPDLFYFRIPVYPEHCQIVASRWEIDRYIRFWTDGFLWTGEIRI